MTTISESFGNLGITINNTNILEMEKAVVHFVLRKTHPLTFDGPYLAVDPVAFLPADYNLLFDVFKTSKTEIEKVIRTIPSIDKSFVVTSEPFNLLSLWLIHLAPIFINNKKICYNFQMNVLRYYHYRIFTSVVNNSFRHGANQGIMEATVSGLSRKSDIIRYESWKRLIDSHCEKMLDPEDRFFKTIMDGSPDDMFLRAISESQTALRAKIVTFAQAYYESHSAGDMIKSKSSIAENDDGERIIAQTASVIDSATQSMVAEILNPNVFIHDISVEDVAKMSMTISSRMLKTALLRINEVAVLQAASKTFDKVEIEKDGVLYVGVRVLIIEIIRSMVRMCREKRVNMGNRGKVFEKMKDAYTSSRNLDPDVVAIKKSISNLIDPFNITVNTASQSSLRLAVIYYILYRTIQKMK